MFLANLLDNAVEAACAATGERRFLTLRLEMNGRRLSVFCQNGYDGSLLWGERAALLSNKKESGHGYGLQIMRSVAEKYHCALAVRHDNGRFSVRADLLIPKMCEPRAGKAPAAKIVPVKKQPVIPGCFI